jgi:hypothetical protein
LDAISTPLEQSSPNLSRLLLISSHVEEAELLASAAKEGITPFIYDASWSLDTLLEKIEPLLHPGVQSIAFATHAQEARFSLLDSHTVTHGWLENPDHQAFWHTLCGHLSPQCRFDILGCLVSSTLPGLSLVSKLEKITQRPFAASTTAIGNTSGANWLLESGGVKADNLYFDHALLSQWKGDLSTSAVTSGVIFDGLTISNTLTPPSTPMGGSNATIKITAKLYSALYDYPTQAACLKQYNPTTTAATSYIAKGNEQWGVLFEASLGPDLDNFTVEYNPGSQLLRIRNGSSASPSAYALYSRATDDTNSVAISLDFSTSPATISFNGTASAVVASSGTISFPQYYYPNLKLGRSASQDNPNYFFGEISSFSYSDANSSHTAQYDTQTERWMGSLKSTFSSNLPKLKFNETYFAMQDGYNPDVARALYRLDRLQSLLKNPVAFPSRTASFNGLSIANPAFQSIYTYITEINRMFDCSNPILTAPYSSLLDMNAAKALLDLQAYMKSAGFPYYDKGSNGYSEATSVNKIRNEVIFQFPNDLEAFAVDATNFFATAPGEHRSPKVQQCLSYIDDLITALKEASATTSSSNRSQRILTCTSLSFITALSRIAWKLIESIDRQLTLLTEKIAIGRRGLILMEKLQSMRYLPDIPRNHRGEIAIPTNLKAFTQVTLPYLGDEWMAMDMIFTPTTSYSAGVSLSSAGIYKVTTPFKLNIPLYATLLDKYLGNISGNKIYQATSTSSWNDILDTFSNTSCTHLYIELQNLINSPLLPSSQKTTLKNDILKTGTAVSTNDTANSSKYPLNFGLEAVFDKLNSYSTYTDPFYSHYEIPCFAEFLGSWFVSPYTTTAARMRILASNYTGSIENALLLTTYPSDTSIDIMTSDSTNSTIYSDGHATAAALQNFIKDYKRYYLLFRWLDVGETDLNIANTITSFQNLNEDLLQNLKQQLSDYRDLIGIISALNQKWMSFTSKAMLR